MIERVCEKADMSFRVAAGIFDRHLSDSRRVFQHLAAEFDLVMRDDRSFVNIGSRRRRSSGLTAPLR